MACFAFPRAPLRPALAALFLPALCLAVSACGDDGGVEGPSEPTCDDGARNGDETGIDCGGPTCGRCGVGATCVSIEDCAETLLCDGGRCIETPTCDDGFRNGDETGVDCGGPCEPCVDGSRCVGDEDCVSGRCVEATCISCTDGVRNGDETDRDCGGTLCGPCDEGDRCQRDADCTTMACAGNRCVSCDDGIANAEETDVDCGGPVCAACPDAAACVEGTDCASGVCEDSVCISCMDGVQNGLEVGVDCGGGVCGGCADGAVCFVDGDCASEACEDGQCISCGDGLLNGAETDVDCGGADCSGCAEGGACVEDGDCAGGPCVELACTVDCAPFAVGASSDYTSCSYTATAPPCPDISSTGTAAGLEDDDHVLVTLPFEFEYFGTALDEAYIESNGALAFLAPALDPLTFENACIPVDLADGDGGETFIAVFWDDLDPERTLSGEPNEIYYETLGTTPNQRFVVQWTVSPFDVAGGSEGAIDVRLVLYETSNRIEVCYVDTDTSDTADCATFGDCHAAGVSATAGIQGTRAVAVEYSCGAASLGEGLVLRYDPT